MSFLVIPSLSDCLFCLLGFVDYISFHVFPRDCTFVFVAAITRIVDCVGNVDRDLPNDSVVVFVD